jgi:hypothetical protein
MRLKCNACQKITRHTIGVERLQRPRRFKSRDMRNPDAPAEWITVREIGVVRCDVCGRAYGQKGNAIAGVEVSKPARQDRAGSFPEMRDEVLPSKGASSQGRFVFPVSPKEMAEGTPDCRDVADSPSQRETKGDSG